VCVRIPRFGPVELSMQRKVVSWFLPLPIPCLRVRGRRQGENAKYWDGDNFRAIPQDNPGKPGKRSWRTGSRGPRRVACLLCGQLSPVPPGGFAAKPGTTRMEGRGGERGSFAALRTK